MIHKLKFKCQYIFKLKCIFLLILSFFILSLISKIINNCFLQEKSIYLNRYLILQKLADNPKNKLIFKEKRNILNLISQTIKKNITNLYSIFYTTKCKFGNLLVILNKLIFFCEILNCKKIILDKNIFWFIKKKIIINNSNITIDVDDKKKYYNNSFIIYYDSDNIFYTIFQIKPNIKINYLRNEILSNLPKTNTSKKDLYIHVRSGDIFIISHYPYAQPPLCFYLTILKYFRFNNISI